MQQQRHRESYADTQPRGYQPPSPPLPRRTHPYTGAPPRAPPLEVACAGGMAAIRARRRPLRLLLASLLVAALRASTPCQALVAATQQQGDEEVSLVVVSAAAADDDGVLRAHTALCVPS